jgi:hypothetical protein
MSGLMIWRYLTLMKRWGNSAGWDEEEEPYA